MIPNFYQALQKSDIYTKNTSFKHASCASDIIRNFDWLNRTACPLACLSNQYVPRTIQYKNNDILKESEDETCRNFWTFFETATMTIDYITIEMKKKISREKAYSKSEKFYRNRNARYHECSEGRNFNLPVSCTYLRHRRRRRAFPRSTHDWFAWKCFFLLLIFILRNDWGRLQNHQEIHNTLHAKIMST